MASISLPLSQARKRTEAKTANRTPSVRAIIIVCVALLILFGWLHLILALEIASTGRQIQIQTAQLDQIERRNDWLQWQAASVCSSANMAERAKSLGFEPQQPIYLPLLQPVAQR